MVVAPFAPPLYKDLDVPQYRDLVVSRNSVVSTQMPYSPPKLNPLAVVDDDLYWDAQWLISELEESSKLGREFGFADDPWNTSPCLDVLHRIPKPE